MEQDQTGIMKLVQKMSKIVSDTQEVLQQINLPQKEINLRIETFFNQILQVCNDFEQTQSKFLDDLKSVYEKIDTENSQLKSQLQIQDTDLNQIFQLQNEKPEKFSYQIYQNSVQVNNYLKQTLKDRYEKLVTLLNQIQVKCSILDIKLPDQVFTSLNIDKEGDYQHQIEYFQLPSLTLQQLEQINQVNGQLDQQLAPLIEKTQKLTEEIKKNLLLLDRCDLGYYYQNVDQLGLTEKYIAFIDDSLKGNLQPKFDQQLIDFNSFIDKEVKERQSYTENVIKQIVEMCDNIQICLSCNIDQSLVEQQLPQIWSQEIIEQMQNISNISQNAEDYMTDKKHSELRTQYEQFAALYQQQIVLAVQSLYETKQILLSTVQKQEQHVNAKEQLQPTTNQIRSLIQQIQQVQTFIVQFQPVKELLIQYHQNLEKAKELKIIQGDKTRYTSKGREAVAKRRRETQLQTELLKYFPAILAKLSCILKEMQKQEKKQQGFKVSEILGQNYIKQIDSVVCQQDKRFQQKYNTLVMRLNSEAERKMKQSIKSSQVEKSQSQVDKSCFVIKSIVESQIQ